MGGHAKRAARIAAERDMRNRPPVMDLYEEPEDDGRYDGLNIDDVFDGGEEPPLYPMGKLSNMSDEELARELTNQCDIQGHLGDAEIIDEFAVERTEARIDLLTAEVKKRRKLR